MEEGEDHHLDAKKEGWDSNFQVWIGNFGRGADYAQGGRGEDTDQEGLPEREENDQFDGENLQEGPVMGKVEPKLDVELNKAVHGNGHRSTLDNKNLILLVRKERNGRRADAYPDVSKHGRVGGLAVFAKILCDNGSDGHSHAYKAVLVDTRPDDIEPSQTAPWGPPRPPLSSTALSPPADWQDPWLCLNATEVSLLVVQVRRNVVTEKGEEGGNGEGFVAFGDDLEVYGMPIKPETEE